MGGRDARKEKNDECEKREKRKRKKMYKEKRKDGGKLRQYIRKTKLVAAVSRYCVRCCGCYLCFLYTCARCVLMCGLRLPPQFLHLPASIASACFPRDFVNRKSNRRLFEIKRAVAIVVCCKQ